MNSPRVAISILNWKRWKETLECLESLYLVDYPDFVVFIADNGSDDESVEKIRNWAKDHENKIQFTEHGENDFLELKDKEAGRVRFYLIKNSTNLGFARGHNVTTAKMIECCNPEYILLLNNDTIVEKDFIKNLVKGLLSDNGLAAVNPLIYSGDPSSGGEIACFGSHLNIYTGAVTHFFRGEVNPVLPRLKYVNFLEGSALLIKTSIFTQLGGFDEKFFAYFEDVDLSLRLSRKGYKLASVASAIIWHKGSRSSTSDKRAYFLIRNLIWFMRKNASPLQSCVFFLYLPFKIAYLVLIKSKFSTSYIKSITAGVREGLFS